MGDQFLIGDEVLVAPVTDKGASYRDIYFPGYESTMWRDERNNKVGSILLQLEKFSL